MAIGREGTHQLVQALTMNTSITTGTTNIDGTVLRLVRGMLHNVHSVMIITVKDRIQFR